MQTWRLTNIRSHGGGSFHSGHEQVVQDVEAEQVIADLVVLVGRREVGRLGHGLDEAARPSRIADPDPLDRPLGEIAISQRANGRGAPGGAVRWRRHERELAALVEERRHREAQRLAEHPLLFAVADPVLGRHPGRHGGELVIQEHGAALDRIRHVDAIAAPVQDLNWGGDRVDMANAVESRPVFLDHQLAAVAARVPPEYRIRDGKEKWVLREALRFAMPPFLYERRKFAFMAPPAHRSSGRAAAVRALADRYLAERSIERVGICDPRRTRRFVESMTETTDLATANEHDKICNHLLGLHILHA